MPNRQQIDAPPIAPPVATRADLSALGADSNGRIEPAISRESSASEPLASATLAPPVASTASVQLESLQVAASNNVALNTIATEPTCEADKLEPESQAESQPANRGWSSAMGRTPAALASFIVHTLLLLLLALLTVAPRVGDPNSHTFEAAIGDGNDDESLVQPVEVLAAGDEQAAPAEILTEVQNASEVSQASLSNSLNHSLDHSLNELQTIDPSSSRIALPQPSLANEMSKATSNLSMATLASTGVEGRSAENRDRTAKARGGTLQSELAVERALEWLAAHQLPSGGWSLVHDGGKCNGQCKNNGSDARYEPAATGLALLAFLGAGYTHQSGKHQRTVQLGVYYLMQIMEEANNAGSFLHQSERGMYNHGIAAFALCEAYQLSGDQDLKNPAQLAVNFIFSAQNYSGGWGYLPKQPGDLTISGWQMMAIKSAHAAGLDVPPAVIIRIDHFLDTKQLPPGTFYGYSNPERDPTCSAIGVLLRLFRGWSHTDPRALELAQFLVKKGRANGDVYYNYYATLLLFHLGGPAWEAWNPLIREHLVKTQNQTGHEAGSWYFEDQYAKEGGRLYTTAMCAMTLEVYYRFSPLYQQADRPFEL